MEGKKQAGGPLKSGPLLVFGRLDEKKFCLLQVLRYRRVVKQYSAVCYKRLKSDRAFMDCFEGRFVPLRGGNDYGKIKQKSESDLPFVQGVRPGKNSGDDPERSEGDVGPAKD